MNKVSLAALLLSLLLFLASLLIAGLSRHRSKRTMLRLAEMIDQATNGRFSPACYDESLLSALEASMSAYLNASAVSAQKLAEEKDTIEALIGDISHQTKTPIANVLLYAQLLGEETLTAQGETCAAALCTQAEKLAFLIDGLVKTSRLESGILTLHPRNQSLAPLFERVLVQAAPKASCKQIRFSVTGEGLAACYDLKWTTEALYNILDNAIKYSPNGSEIRLCATQYELFTRLDVSDTGIGIPEHEQAKVFVRFYRSATLSEMDGIGLGLSLARQIVTGQGGYLKLSSRPGSGSTFSVFLPPKQEVFQNC